MTIPSIFFALLLALLLGALYHFIRGGGAWHLFVYLLASPAGFVAGHFVGAWRGWALYKLGALDLGMDVLGGLILLVIADVFLHWEPRKPPEDKNAV